MPECRGIDIHCKLVWNNHHCYQISPISQNVSRCVPDSSKDKVNDTDFNTENVEVLSIFLIFAFISWYNYRISPHIAKYPRTSPNIPAYHCILSCYIRASTFSLFKTWIVLKCSDRSNYHSSHSSFLSMISFSHSWRSISLFYCLSLSQFNSVSLHKTETRMCTHRNGQRQRQKQKEPDANAHKHTISLSTMRWYLVMCGDIAILLCAVISGGKPVSIYISDISDTLLVSLSIFLLSLLVYVSFLWMLIASQTQSVSLYMLSERREVIKNIIIRSKIILCLNLISDRATNTR